MSNSRISRQVGGVPAEGPALQPPPPFTVPIFMASAVTGASLPLLHTFLNALQPPDVGASGDLLAAGGTVLGKDGVFGGAAASAAGGGAPGEGTAAVAAEIAGAEGGTLIHFQV